ncbi:MAG: hypothetical protein Q9217_006677 [Psora testacea]
MLRPAQPTSPSKPLRPNADNPLPPPPEDANKRQHLKERSGNQGQSRKPSSKSNDMRAGQAENLEPEKRIRSSKTLMSLLERDRKTPKKQADGKGENNVIKKSKSSTSMSAIFSKPGSSKGKREDELGEQKDKENQRPPETPIWAQFATTKFHPELSSTTKVPLNDRPDLQGEIALYTPLPYSPSKQRNFPEEERPTLCGRSQKKLRPKSECLSSTAQASLADTISGFRRSRLSREEPRPDLHSSRKSVSTDQHAMRRTSEERGHAKGDASTLTVGKRGSRVMAAVAALNGKSKDLPKEPTKGSAPEKLDPQAIECAFESLLDARNVPQNTRDKMRSLDTNIKANFIKQDKAGSGSASSAEGLAAQTSRPDTVRRSRTNDSTSHNVGERPESSHSAESQKKSRPRSRTFTFSKGEGSPSKKQKSDRSGGHHRSKSGESKAPELSKPLGSPDTTSKCYFGLFGKGNILATPEDYIAYLRNVEQPQEVEVGKIHKLRQLLRNETVEWVNSFITDGGMTEVVSLLYRIIAVEWREEHEDALLHETLSCLKALSTTSLALEHLTTMHNIFFPRLLGLLFSEEKKGPSEFATRTIIITLFSTYLSSAPTPDITARARNLLHYLRDPSKPEVAQLPGFIASMHHPRPYRVWNKEMTDVTKEVFWIFLHHMNVVPYPSEAVQDRPGSTYLIRHFPQPHPPIPTAPYVGSVEWEATSYLTAHLDLLNGLLASLPTCDERNALRQELKVSGFEKAMGGSLRTCKEKFYGSVHLALTTWVGAAKEDGWDVKGVREGALPQTASDSPKKSPVKKGKVEKAPVLELPKFDLGGGMADGKEDGGWL